jgi:hypothetical protein
MKTIAQLKRWFSAIVQSLKEFLPVQGWQDKSRFHYGKEPDENYIDN